MTITNDKPKINSCQDNLIIDQDTHHHYIILPNLIDDINLSPAALKLYVHFKRVCGETEGGQCWQSARTMEKLLRFSRHTIIKAKRELETADLVVIEKSIGDTDIIRIVDIWHKNHEAYPRIEKAVVQKSNRGGGAKNAPPVVQKMHPKNNPLKNNPDDDDDDIALTEFLKFIKDNFTSGKLPPHLKEKATKIFNSCPAGRALEAAQKAVESGGKSLAYVEQVIKNWDKPKPEKPHHLTNYRGRSPVNKNLPKQWPGQDKNAELWKKGISPATGKVIGSGFSTF